MTGIGNEARIPEPKQKKRGCFAYGCLTLILLALVCGVVGLGAYLYGRRAVTPYVDQYMQAVDAGPRPGDALLGAGADALQENLLQAVQAGYQQDVEYQHETGDTDIQVLEVHSERLQSGPTLL